MVKENESLNSLNEEYSFEESELSSLRELEGDALKEKVNELFTGKSKKIIDTNRRLFARAKKAEGFEENDEGDWVKTQKPESKEKLSKGEKPDDKLIERLDKLALNVAGIKEADEIELFNNWKEQTGREADNIVGNDIFKKELESLRTAKAALAATSNIQGENGQSGAKGNPDYWIAKATKGKDGKLEFPEETPKELYSKILDKLSSGEPGSSENLRFYDNK